MPPAVIDEYVGRRLLVSDRDRDTREPTIELAHEIIITALAAPDATGSTRTANGSPASASSAKGAAAWERSGRDDGELLRGGRLVAVGEQLEHRRDRVTDSEAEFVEASRAHAELERTAVERQLDNQVRSNRVLRRSLIAVGVVLVAALVASIVAITQRSQAQAARREALVTTLEGRSLALRSTERDVAALLAVEAANRRPRNGGRRRCSARSRTIRASSVTWASTASSRWRCPSLPEPARQSWDRSRARSVPTTRRYARSTSSQASRVRCSNRWAHTTTAFSASSPAVTGGVWRSTATSTSTASGGPPPCSCTTPPAGRKTGTPIVLSESPDDTNFAIALNHDGSQVAVSAARVRRHPHLRHGRWQSAGDDPRRRRCDSVTGGSRHVLGDVVTRRAIVRR